MEFNGFGMAQTACGGMIIAKVAKWFCRKFVDLVSYLISPLVELYKMIQKEEI